MATYAELAVLASRGSFQIRVNYAIFKAAVDVYAEDTSTALHAARLAFAKKVMKKEFDLQAATLAVLTNSTLASEADESGDGISDSDMQFTVNSLWNFLAGA